MELKHLDSPADSRRQNQRWQDPSAAIFREQSLNRPKKSHHLTASSSAPQGSRSTQALVTDDPSPTVSRHSAFTAAASSTTAVAATSRPISVISADSAKMTCCHSCCECLGRIPYGSLVATLITGAGIAVSCGCSFIGIPHLINMLRKFSITIKDDIGDALSTGVISVGAVMATLAIVLLIIGFLATGATRRQVYTGTWSRITGRIAAAFFILLTYFLMIVWFLICCLLLVVTVFFVLSITNCNMYKSEDDFAGNCFNVSTIVEGIPANFNADTLSTRLCGTDFYEYCVEARQGEYLFYAANGGVALIVLGLIHFLMCLAANYAHIKDGLKLREYEEAKYTIDTRDYASF